MNYTRRGLHLEHPAFCTSGFTRQGSDTHPYRLHSSSLLGLPRSNLNIDHEKGSTTEPMGRVRFKDLRVHGLGTRVGVCA